MEQDDDLEARLAPPAPLHNAYLARFWGGGGNVSKNKSFKGNSDGNNYIISSIVAIPVRFWAIIYPVMYIYLGVIRSLKLRNTEQKITVVVFVIEILRWPMHN